MKSTIRISNYFIFVFFIVLCLFGACLSFTFGQASIPYNEIVDFLTLKSGADSSYAMILKMRISRIAVAFITGAGLSFSGVIYQSALKNYLADPFMLGISAGAALFSAIAIALKFSSSLVISLFAFSGAVVSVGIVIFISWIKNFANYNLILTGIAVNSFFSSFLTVVMYLSRDMQNIFFWLMGSLDVKYGAQIVYTYLIVFFCCIYAVKNSYILDILKLNEKTIFSIGVDYEFHRIRFLLLASIVCAVLVSQTGIIGFVGLIVPHAARILIGDSHAALLPFSFLLGGSMMIYCDLLSRTMADSLNFPIGIITSLVGAPFFIMLLMRKTPEAAHKNG